MQNVRVRRSVMPAIGRNRRAAARAVGVRRARDTVLNRHDQDHNQERDQDEQNRQLSHGAPAFKCCHQPAATAGVGFIVGGLVDVLAISGLDQVQRRRENDLEARLILRDAIDPGGKTADAADELLARAGRQIDRRWREDLMVLVFRVP